MKNNKLFLAIAIVIAICSTTALANDDKINYSISAKMWNNQLQNTGDIKSESANTPIYSLTAKKGDYFVVASFLVPTTYTRGTTYTTRRDADLALGWSLNPNISLLAGHKVINAPRTSSGTRYDETVHFNYIGANGFTSLSESQFLYGTVTKSLKGTDTSGGVTQSVNLTTYEFGYGYVLNQFTQLSAGYRMQKIGVTGGSGSQIPGLLFGASFNIK
jgi:hypothetical protein